MKDENSTVRPHPAQPARGNPWLFFPRPVAWVVLLISLVASAGGYFIARKHAELTSRKAFDEEVTRISGALKERMQIYEDVLHGAMGLFAASYSVERAEWRSYLASVSIERRFPGIDGVGFITYLPRDRLEEFLRTTRADKSPDFQLKDPGQANDLLIVKYLEPEERHSAMLGMDIGSDPERRAMAERARDSGKAALSSIATLPGEGPTPERGCLMLLPVYRNGAPTSTVSERQASIAGWVFGRFVSKQLMQAVLGSAPLDLHLRIFDSKEETAEHLVFDNDPRLTSKRPDERALFFATTPIKLGGRTWMSHLSTKPSFEAASRRGVSLWVAAAGAGFSLLLFGIVCSLSHTRERALAIAAEMTQTLRETNKWLEHERFLLRTLMDNVPDRIYFKDRKSRFLRNSRAHLRAFGLERPEQAIGKSDFDFFSDEHARQAYEDEQRLMAAGEALTKEEKETWQDGSVTWALSTKMPLRDESGEIIGTFGISRDITDRKRAEEVMRQAKEAAEEANRTKSRFLASMSHELRTPLNSVIGFANILLKNKAGALAPLELNFLERILANGKHLLTLINEILDLSKIEAHKVELQTSSVALDVLIRETLAQQESLVRDKPVQLLAELPRQVAPIVADADRLRQVIINLVANAVKFTEQGSVTVRLVTDPEDQRPRRIEVIDTGIGIPADKLGVIFEAFQQAEVGTTRKYGGTGLGLTISQALCRLMGYHIEAASEPGRGSTFTVCLDSAPAATRRLGAPPKQSAAPVQTSPSESRFRDTLVLVIDDELDSRLILTHAIEEAGCRAMSASSGQEGLRMAREFHPDLITVDLFMPGMDGRQVIRALKADPALSNIPVIVVSVSEKDQTGLLAQDMVRKGDRLEADLKRVLDRFLQEAAAPTAAEKA